MRYKGKKKQKPLFIEGYTTVTYKEGKAHVRMEVMSDHDTYCDGRRYEAKDKLHADALGMLYTIQYAGKKFNKIKMLMIHINSRRLPEIIWPFHGAICPRKRHQKVVREIKSLEGRFSLRVKSTLGKYKPDYDEMFKDDPIIIRGMKELGIEPKPKKLTFGVS